jgi:TonB-dependent SusC/RagA subfamily outer membrane receptor
MIAVSVEYNPTTMKRLFTTLLCGAALLLLTPGLALGQATGTIEGTVTDASDGSSLPGATVQVPEEGIGTATDSQGQYALEDVPAGTHVLRVSFVGYETLTQEVSVEAGETVTRDFSLELQAAELGEVVVTGLAQEQSQAESSVSVTSIDAQELTDNADFQSVEELFQGNTPGVTVSKSSGNVGSGIRFNVRSGVSLNSDGQPVIYIDGTRIDAGEVEGFGAGGQGTSALSDLNPDDIKSIEVLKGPSATALYGTDGADGVVIIETKSGGDLQEDGAVRVNYSGTIGYTEKVEEYSSDTFVNAETANDQFREGDITENRLSLSGRTGSINYSASYTNRQTDGITPNNSGERNNVRANFEANPTDEWRFSASSGLTINEQTRPGNDNLLRGIFTSTLLGTEEVPSLFGPIDDILAVDDQFRAQRFNGSVTTSYSPTQIDGLRARLQLGGDVNSRRQDQTFPRGIVFPGGAEGERNIFNRENRQFNGDVNVRYGYDVASNLSASSTVGLQLFTESTQTSFLTSQDFGSAAISDIGTGATLDAMGEDVFNRRSGGIFARQTFSYNDAYNLNVSLRRDISTKIQPGDNGTFTAWYPGVRGNVRLEQLGILPEYFSQFKIRAAFGQTGALPGVLDTQELRLTGTQSGFGTGGTIGSVGSPDLEAETVSEIEGGIDVGINNRYTFSATYYYQQTNNSIVDFQPAPSTGLGDFNQPRNVGEITGQGVETALDLTLLQTETARVRLNTSYSYRFAEVQELNGQALSGVFDQNFVREGLAPSTFYGLEVDGAEFNEAGEFAGPNIIDQNDDGVINSEDRVKLGNPTPDHFGGITLNVQFFDNLTVTGRAEYQLGHQVWNGTKEFATSNGVNPRVSELNTQLGELEVGSDAYRSAANELAELNTQDRLFGNFLEDADFLKIREIGVSYDFTGLADRFIASDLPVREFRVKLSGQNLFTFTDYSGPDPQVNFNGGRGITAGQDFFTLQQPRTFTASVSVGF